MMITGTTMEVKKSNIVLRPMDLTDKETFYQWATNSDATPYWYGSIYGDEIPSRKEFFNDYDDEYFDKSKSCKKGVLAIRLIPEEKEIGAVNYQLASKSGEKYYDIDILIASDKDKNQGYGSSAIKTLIEILRETCRARNFMIHALENNVRAKKAYKKAGFKMNRKYLDSKGLYWYEFILKF